jgi:hypothetical protein
MHLTKKILGARNLILLQRYLLLCSFILFFLTCSAGPGYHATILTCSGTMEGGGGGFATIFREGNLPQFREIYLA